MPSLFAWAALAAAAAAFVLAVVVRVLVGRVRALRSEVATLRSTRQSMAARHGQTVEQFAPLLSSWPWDPKGFRFLGSPVDGVQFNDDGVVFIEIKTAGGQLSVRQRAIREAVEAGRVTWAEVRV